MDENQIKELEKKLAELNTFLEDLLHIQFGIDDQEWIKAISTIEDGYALARTWIEKVK
jgi:hypothetical protein